MSDVKQLSIPNGSVYNHDAERFTARLNSDPEETRVKRNPHAGNSMYLPITDVEMTLDRMFQGLWQTRNFTQQVVANEIIGHIELGVFHPVLRDWIWRTGAASVMIQQSKGSDITDIGAKIKNTLVKDFPHLKTECVKNAARSLGKIFGRDLNRNDEDIYTPASADDHAAELSFSKLSHEAELGRTKAQIRGALSAYKGEDRAELVQACKDNANDLDNLKNILETLTV